MAAAVRSAGHARQGHGGPGPLLLLVGAGAASGRSRTRRLDLARDRVAARALRELPSSEISDLSSRARPVVQRCDEDRSRGGGHAPVEHAGAQSPEVLGAHAEPAMAAAAGPGYRRTCPEARNALTACSLETPRPRPRRRMPRGRTAQCRDCADAETAWPAKKRGAQLAPRGERAAPRLRAARDRHSAFADAAASAFALASAARQLVQRGCEAASSPRRALRWRLRPRDADLFSGTPRRACLRGTPAALRLPLDSGDAFRALSTPTTPPGPCAIDRGPPPPPCAGGGGAHHVEHVEEGLARADRQDLPSAPRSSRGLSARCPRGQAAAIACADETRRAAGAHPRYLRSSHFFTQAFRLPQKLLSQPSPRAQQRVSPHCTPRQVQSPSFEPQISPTRQHQPNLIAWSWRSVQRLLAVASMLQNFEMLGLGEGPPDSLHIFTDVTA